MKNKSEYKVMPPTDLRGYHPSTSVEVHYAVGVEYNGGIALEDGWYKGYEVPPPLLPIGYGIVSMHCGMELNAHPPMAVGKLMPLERIKKNGWRYMNSFGEWIDTEKQEEEDA